jgi:hypothetical protein
MANSLSSYIEIEGAELLARQKRLSPTSLQVTWNIPADAKAYNGAIVLCSPVELNPSNYPTNGVRYKASANFAIQADSVGLAQVVAACYDDDTTNTITITNLEPDKAYFIAVHLATNVYTYYQSGVRTYPSGLASEVYAGDIPSSATPPENPTLGEVYYDPAQKMLFAWDGTKWAASMAQTVITGNVDPVSPFTGLPAGYPKVGDYFYNTFVQMLKYWDGTKWVDAESKKGLPISDVTGIGTTGDTAAREHLKDVLKHQLGYPVVCVELNDVHFNIAIDNALQELRRRVDTAYNRQYIFMNAMKNQSIYYLNDPTTGTNKIVDVIKIHRLNLLGLTNFSPDNIFAQQFLNQFYAPGNGYDLVSVHLVNALSETYNQLFAGDVAFNWWEAQRELRLYRTMGNNEKVLLECSMEKTEQEILTDRWMQQWVQQWAEAEAMIMLGRIRGKYTSLPGPGGGLSLNASELVSEANNLQLDCLRQVKDYEVGQNGPNAFYSPFIIG